MDESRPQQTHVLAILHSDGFAEIFGQNHVNCRIINMPKMHSPDGEIRAEEFLTTQLPRPYRDVYFPGMVRATANLQTETPFTLGAAITERNLLRYIDSIATSLEVAK